MLYYNNGAFFWCIKIINLCITQNKKFANFKLSETKYKFSLTNINEVQFDKFENLKPLDFEKFKAILTNLHLNYKLGKSDSELEELVKNAIAEKQTCQ